MDQQEGDQRERLLTTTSAAILPLGVDGHPLHGRQDQIRAVVERRLGRRHALLLAEAEHRPDSDITDWYSPAAGAAIGAAAMDEEGRNALRGEIDALLADIDRLGGELERAKGAAAQAAGRHLRLAARRSPDDAFLYRVGEQPVLVAWGHDDTRPAVKVAPPVAAATPAAAVPAVAAAEPPPPPPPAPTPLRETEEKKRGVFPWRLIAAGLAAFLAGLGTAWILARFMPPSIVQVADDQRRVVPVTVVLQREIDRLREEGEQLRATLASLRQEFARKHALCPPPGLKPQEERVVCTRPPRRARMVVIFDTSNSMGLPTDSPEDIADLERRWGAGDAEAQRRGMELVRGPGHKRIDDARAAALGLVEAMPPNIDVGLITFLTRCEVGVDVRPGEPRADVAEELRRVQPRASTPLAAALRLAASQLSTDPAIAAAQSIVVITDGHEGCGGDPCAAAADLKAAFPSVKVHVIDVVGISRLQCVADITGGSTVGARDTGQLKAAMRRTQAAIEQDACR
ncbi:MAG: VWA domain-containing protein [Alphaproteobacteria bacterium]|nr:VWA domain-containing protein [Alphaproteobacteria bacterium]MCW5742387.1 VWA domain-containing protein [Alphaproteobacteria bacterium]